MVVAEFDEIAQVYDETRRPLDEETVRGMKEMLTKHGCHSILEIGVGTGRVAVPLEMSGFEITGVDISRKMMEIASGKGIKNLVLAIGNQVPFKDKTFDATIMAHVFHLLEDPIPVLKESARACRIGVFALIRKGARGERWEGFVYGIPDINGPQGNQAVEIDEPTRKYYEERRERFRVLATKYGWKPDLSRMRRWEKEQEILAMHPPDDLRIVSDVVVNESIEDRINRFEKGAFSSISTMPEEMRKELVSEMRESAAKHPERASHSRHEIYQLAMWNPGTLNQ